MHIVGQILTSIIITIGNIGGLLSIIYFHLYSWSITLNNTQYQINSIMLLIISIIYLIVMLTQQYQNILYIISILSMLIILAGSINMLNLQETTDIGTLIINHTIPDKIKANLISYHISTEIVQELMALYPNILTSKENLLALHEILQNETISNITTSQDINNYTQQVFDTYNKNDHDQSTSVRSTTYILIGCAILMGILAS